MKIYVTMAIMFLAVLCGRAQTMAPSDLDSLDMKEPRPIAGGSSFDRLPTFPGGFFEFWRFLEKNTRYPDSAKKNHIQGTVLVGVVIESDGQLGNVKALNSISPDIDKEALRVIRSSPKWVPGIKNGQPVSVSYSIPLHFILDKDDSPAFNHVDVEPEFPGGKEGYSGYIKKNMRFPPSITESSGFVIVSFVVEKDGSLTDIRVFKATTQQMADEALRLLYNSPKWKPGLFENHPVRVNRSLTIPFDLDY